MIESDPGPTPERSDEPAAEPRSERPPPSTHVIPISRRLAVEVVDVGDDAGVFLQLDGEIVAEIEPAGEA